MAFFTKPCYFYLKIYIFLHFTFETFWAIYINISHFIETWNIETWALKWAVSIKVIKSSLFIQNKAEMKYQMTNLSLNISLSKKNVSF